MMLRPPVSAADLQDNFPRRLAAQRSSGGFAGPAPRERVPVRFFAVLEADPLESKRSRHPRGSGGPGQAVCRSPWIPAFAGMTHQSTRAPLTYSHNLLAFLPGRPPFDQLSASGVIVRVKRRPARRISIGTSVWAR